MVTQKVPIIGLVCSFCSQEDVRKDKVVTFHMTLTGFNSEFLKFPNYVTMGQHVIGNPVVDMFTWRTERPSLPGPPGRGAGGSSTTTRILWLQTSTRLLLGTVPACPV